MGYDVNFAGSPLKHDSVCRDKGLSEESELCLGVLQTKLQHVSCMVREGDAWDSRANTDILKNQTGHGFRAKFQLYFRVGSQRWVPISSCLPRVTMYCYVHLEIVAGIRGEKSQTFTLFPLLLGTGFPSMTLYSELLRKYSTEWKLMIWFERK